MKTKVGQLEVSCSARGISTYRLEMWHEGLKKHRMIKGESGAVVRRKAEIQEEEWNQKWNQITARNNDLSAKGAKKKQQEDLKALATRRTSHAVGELERLDKILSYTLDIDDAINWDSLLDKSPFPEPAPKISLPPPIPQQNPKPVAPSIEEARFEPRFGLLEMIIPSRRAKSIAASKALFEKHYQDWQEQVESNDKAFDYAMDFYNQTMRRQQEQHQSNIASWEERKAKFLAQQSIANSEVESFRISYLNADPEAIVEYCDMVLSASNYPDYFPKEYDLEYNPDSKLLIVEYILPAPEEMPRLKGVKYVASKDEFEEQFIAEAAATKQYDSVLYQLALRTIHEIFESDTIEAIATVVFNGIVSSLDRSTGKKVTACILSLQAQRKEFLEINLANVDPKACFKALKGVGSSKLHGLVPVAPVLKLKKDDARFVAAYGVADTLDSSFNLAAMSWEDFEHLIREVFEKEFSTNGGEVKVTQASRDGGVDAIAFDPDPLRGGKIVIQAKRYSNTVGVAAVRDLYGTVMNEGANKGILVTTSDYGPDSYAFANGKPLVLLNGANLLHLLEKHGHRARIDLKEAKMLEREARSAEAKSDR